MNDLSGSRRGFEKRKICRSIFMMCVLCLVLLLTACVTDTGTNADYSVDDILSYPKGPLAFENYSNGELRSVTEVETFEITDIYINDKGTHFIIYYEVIGTVTGGDFFDLPLKCYDEDGFLLDNTMSASGKVEDGERFKVADYTVIPINTVEIRIPENNL